MPLSMWVKRNYLRVRGEYPGAFRQPRHQRELPPRARRILIACLQGCLQGGTTSACAENTLGLELGDFFIRNYLRVRGEYGSLAFRHDAVGELPPRARRIPSRSKQVTRTHGTTSACAENTRRRGRWGFSHRNYLRVRGEYPPVRSWQPPLRELPPRARRIRRDCLYGHAQHGTTSACAENTRSDRGGALFVGNYLRVRGEYALLPELFLLKSELPPRARRIRFAPPLTPVPHGTTSACAENTFPW